MYSRVIPRDLFNESKLLKCLGQLVLLIHDGTDKNGREVPESLSFTHENETEGFEITQNPGDGSLYCSNLRFHVGQEEQLDVRLSYNSRSPYPLIFQTDCDDSGNVFNDNGTLADEFLEYLGQLTPR